MGTGMEGDRSSIIAESGTQVGGSSLSLFELSLSLSKAGYLLHQGSSPYSTSRSDRAPE